MRRLPKIDQAFQHFIDLGGLMTPQARAYAAQLLFQHLVNPAFPSMEAFEEAEPIQAFPNWASLIRELLEEQELRKLTRHNEDFAMSVTREALSWLRNTYFSFQADLDFADEEKALEEARQQAHQAPPQFWQERLEFLKETYPREQAQWTFYERRLREWAGQQEAPPTPGSYQQQQITALKQKIRESWEHLFGEKKRSAESTFLQGAFQRYYGELQSKIEQLSNMGDLIAPYYSFFGHAWNNSLGNWEDIKWDQLAEYGRKLQGDPQLRALAAQLGRWHLHRKEKEVEQMKATQLKSNWQPSPYGKSEIIGIHESDQLSTVIPAEFALLSSPETALIFSKKFVEKKLLAFHYRSPSATAKNQQASEHTRQSYSDEKGPVIICVDTSGSMYGEPERIAKSLAFGILDFALKDKRSAFLISFSTDIQTLEMTGIERDFEKMIDFLQRSFHGGTDLQPALAAALDMLDKERFKKADVLVISDFVIPYIDKGMQTSIEQHRQNQGTHFHSLYITRRLDPRSKPLPIFDTHWVYDLNNPQIIRQTFDHFQAIGRPTES